MAARTETCAVVKSLCDSRTLLLSHDTNRGVGSAITTGYQSALSHGTDLVVVMGADNQMNPDEIVWLLDPIIDDQADYTKGNRLGHPDHKKIMPLIRRLGTWTLSYLDSIATGISDLKDSQCGFTAISTNALNSIPIQRLFPRYGYPNDLLSLLSVARNRVCNVVVTPFIRLKNLV